MAAVNPTRRRLSALSGVLSGALVGRLMAGVPAATLLARQAQAQSREKLSYLTPFGYLINFVDTMYADSGGYFERAGLEVHIIGGRGSAMSIQQVAAGNVLVSRTGGTDLIKAVAKDPSIVSIGEIYQRDLFYVVSHRDHPLDGPADFAGRTLGVISQGGASDNLLDMMMAATGLAPSDLKRQVTGDSPGAWAVLAQGRIDGFLVSQNNLLALKRQGLPLHAWSTDRYAPAPAQVYISSRRIVKERPEALARFLRGVHQTLGALLQDSNLSHVIESMRTRYELAGASGPDGGMETLKSTVEAYRPAWRDQFASDPKGWRSAHDQMARAKLIPAQSQPLYHTDEIRRLAFG